MNHSRFIDALVVAGFYLSLAIIAGCAGLAIYYAIKMRIHCWNEAANVERCIKAAREESVTSGSR